MTIRYDKSVDAIYIKMSQNLVSSTMPISETFILDKDTDGNIVGVEILEASSQADFVRDLESKIREGSSVEKILSEMVVVS